MPHILVIQGANMEWLGRRQPELYGTTTAAELDDMLRSWADDRGVSLDIVYTNIEGEAISRIYDAVRAGTDGLLMNPAGFLYAGQALKDCIVGAAIPYVEVHITNIERRGMSSVLAPVADGVVYGLGLKSYELGLDALIHVIANR